jgi:hypothetical protein
MKKEVKSGKKQAIDKIMEGLFSSNRLEFNEEFE